MNIKTLKLLFFLFICQPGYGQADTLYYYLQDNEVRVSQDKAKYFMKVYKENPNDLIYKREIFSSFDNMKRSTGFSKDDQGKIKHGDFVFFNYKGGKESAGG